MLVINFALYDVLYPLYSNNNENRSKKERKKKEMDGRNAIRSVVRHVAKLSRAKFIVWEARTETTSKKKEGGTSFQSERDTVHR